VRHNFAMQRITIELLTHSGRARVVIKYLLATSYSNTFIKNQNST